MKRRAAAAVAAAAVAAAAAYVYVRTGAPVPVDVFTARTGPIEEVVTSVAAGTVRSRRESVLAAESGTRVSQVRVREGDAVRAGDLLVLLDDPESGPRVDAARAESVEAEELLARAVVRREEAEKRFATDSARARSNLRQAEEDHRRAAGLFRDGFLSRAELDRAETALANAGEDVRTAALGELAVGAARREVASLEARRDAARASLSALEEKRRRLAVTAPFGGVVIRKTAEVGEFKIPGAPLLVLADPGAVYVEAEIDESESARVRPGQPAHLFPDAYLGETFAGTVSSVRPVIEASKEVSRANTIELLPLSPPRPLRLGMSVDVEVVVGRKADALQVPTSAVMERDGAKFVFLDAGGRLARRDVKTGIANWERTEVLSGLAAGDRVVTSLETGKLSPGIRVSPRVRD